MKKRRILISVIIVAVLAAVTSLALYKFLDTNKNKSPGIITATEAEIMDIYLDMLIEHKKFADTIFTDTSNIMEGTGYFGKGGGQKIRTHNNYTLYYAFLYTQLHGTKYMPEEDQENTEYAIKDKEAFLEEVKQKALAGIRYGIYTHNSVKKMQTIEAMATDSGKWWGPNHWQSSLYANGVLFAASLMWDHLDEPLKADVETVAAAEGDRAIRTNPRSYAPGNTGAEENAWDTNGPSLAYCMFPKHKNAEKWREAAIKFAMNTLSRELDRNDSAVIDGKPASKWITTSNLFSDYSLENHQILHPKYIASPLISFGDSVVAFAYHGKPIPEAFKYNVQKVSDNVLKKLVYPTGEWIYPNGCDWTMILPGKLEAFALMSCLLGDEEALMLEARAAKLAYERQKLTEDGRFVHIADIGTEREAVNVKRVVYSYLLHKHVGFKGDGSTATWESFIDNHKGTTTFLDGFVITNNSISRFAALSWKNKLIGLVTPSSDKYSDNKYITHPNLPNIVGSMSIVGTSADKAYITHKNYTVGEKFANGLYAGFSSIGKLSENGGAVSRYIAMTALPSNAVIVMDSTVAERNLQIAAGYVVPISFQTDIVSGQKKTIITEKDKDSFTAGPGVNKEYEGSYVLVDNHTSVILDKKMRITFGDYTLSSGLGGSTLKFYIEPGQFQKGQSINKTSAVIFSNVEESELKKLKSDVEYLNMPEGWQGIFVKDTDGKKYYVVNNFYGQKGAFEYTGETYAPIFMDDMTVAGKTATVSLNDGMASYVGELSKYISTDGKSVQIRNSSSPDRFYIKNNGSDAVKVEIMFIHNGKDVKGSLSLKAGESYLVQCDGKVKTEKIDNFPEVPAKVQNVKAEAVNKEVRISWNKSSNVEKYIITRVDVLGIEKELATLEAGANEYVDKSIEEGKSYRYKVVAVGKFEGFLSEDAFSNSVSVGEYRDNTGRVNVAYSKSAKFQHGIQAAYPEYLAVDDDNATFTVNNNKVPTASSPEWFEIDLAGMYKIDEIWILPRGRYGPRDVEIFYSEDGVNFVSIEKRTLPNVQNAAQNRFEFDSVNATKIKIKITSSYSSKNVQIAEVKVYKSE
ncbi:MAG TPA: hypothetical protein GXZ66_04715 [Clostridiaceae bacterium]|jgi:hypothetical protein|nr:hypothetical protein [Clostridiaceae bacterium]HOA30965.1 discoidin domain-containing protein [Clostridia bacterium]